jgi:sugar lactone lactonase YvrE
MSAAPIRTLVTGLSFTEGTRWHDDRLWFSDAHAGHVMSLSSEADVRVEATMPGPCSGLGWRSDGTLLVLLTQGRGLAKVRQGRVESVIDLSEAMPASGNDLLVDAVGRAYAGNAGFNFRTDETPRSTVLVMVDAQDRVSIVADDLMFPNGMVITPDHRTLIVAETLGRRLTAFTIGSDGRLNDRRVFAELGEVLPDGISLDREGCVWTASPTTGEVLRVRAGGAILERISLGGRGAFACMLGGAERRTLFIATAGLFKFGLPLRPEPAAIVSVDVAVAGDGLP